MLEEQLAKLWLVLISFIQWQSAVFGTRRRQAVISLHDRLAGFAGGVAATPEHPRAAGEATECSIGVR